MNPLEELKKIIEANKDNEYSKEIQDYLKSLNPIKAEDLSELVKTDKEAQSWFDSEKDRHFNTALETWKKNNLDKIVEEEVSKRNPELSEEQKQINDLKKQLEERDRLAKRNELKSKALQIATEKNLPVTKVLDLLVTDDEETTLSNINMLAEDINQAIQAGIEAKFKESGRHFESGLTGNGKPGSFGEELAKSQVVDSSQSEGLKSYFGPAAE